MERDQLLSAQLRDGDQKVSSPATASANKFYGGDPAGREIVAVVISHATLGPVIADLSNTQLAGRRLRAGDASEPGNERLSLIFARLSMLAAASAFL